MAAKKVVPAPSAEIEKAPEAITYITEPSKEARMSELENADIIAQVGAALAQPLDRKSVV